MSLIEGYCSYSEKFLPTSRLQVDCGTEIETPYIL